MKVPIPEKLQGRPTYKGLPIPYIAHIKPDGEADFRITDQEKRREVMLERLCQLCGHRLGKFIFFVGGPRAAEGNQYFEPATHLDCLIYAMQVCPFIAGKMEHAEVTDVQADNPDVIVGVDETYTSVKDPLWVIKKAQSYGFWQLPSGTILLRPTEILYVTKPLLAEKMGPEDWAKVRYQLVIGKEEINV